MGEKSRGSNRRTRNAPEAERLGTYPSKNSDHLVPSWSNPKIIPKAVPGRRKANTSIEQSCSAAGARHAKQHDRAIQQRELQLGRRSPAKQKRDAKVPQTKFAPTLRGFPRTTANGSLGKSKQQAVTVNFSTLPGPLLYNLECITANNALRISSNARSDCALQNLKSAVLGVPRGREPKKTQNPARRERPNPNEDVPQRRQGRHAPAVVLAFVGIGPAACGMSTVLYTYIDRHCGAICGVGARRNGASAAKRRGKGRTKSSIDFTSAPGDVRHLNRSWAGDGWSQSSNSGQNLKTVVHLS
ncbi:hypothetical protein DFH11DRAFT_1742610 [Phellopilus nigrolimitatus]|nr:hypothetical protein DFH11DRAFT_1742610 [Phellopilus nigrolimitatus]